VHNKEVTGLSPDAFRRIHSHSWPGNVRELRNTLERAVLFSDTATIQAEHITFPEESAARPKGKRGPYRIGELDLEKLKKTLREKGGNLREAARALNVPRQTIYFKLRRAGIRASELRHIN
jgi:DNA-binding NtrC family response regulator